LQWLLTAENAVGFEERLVERTLQP